MLRIPMLRRKLPYAKNRKIVNSLTEDRTALVFNVLDLILSSIAFNTMFAVLLCILNLCKIHTHRTSQNDQSWF
jgi:hypothetical protein